jgi:two-component system nitrogen regulation response regulator NtrX
VLRIAQDVRRAVEKRERPGTTGELPPAPVYTSDIDLVGVSSGFVGVMKMVGRVAATSLPVLITGESGTGKEVVARAIHCRSTRAEGNFVAVNCGAVPSELIESELFGHVRGAFTGATGPKRGKFEAADGATLFLDEVGDMSPRMQAKVLRVLEEQRFEPVGSTTPMRVDVRVLAATNKRLEVEIERGNFRSDLLFRLNVIPFEVPPLRERTEDVPLLVEHFNQKFSRSYNKRPKRFEPEAVEALRAYPWPGNVRELRNTVERVVIMHTGQRVTAADLPPLGGEEPPAAAPRFSSFRDASEAHQRDFIRARLAEAEGNVSRAAELMGMDRSHLYRRMKALGINVREERAQTS